MASKLASVTLALAASALAAGAFAQGSTATQSTGADKRGAQSQGATQAQGTSRSQDTAAQSGGKAGSQIAGDERRFIEKAAQHGVAEVELGKLAQQKGASEQVKQFGARMVQDHGKANEELKQIAGNKGVQVPAAPDKRHQRDMERMAKLSGEQFDREYMKNMVKDHKADVKDFEKQAKSAKDPELKAFAAKTLPTLQEHLRLAQATEDGVKGATSKGRASGDRGNNDSNAASRGGTGSGTASGAGTGATGTATAETSGGRMANPSGSANQSGASTTQSGTGASTREANRTGN